MPTGPSLGNSIFPAILALLALQALSGIGLALFYSPSTTTAWASVEYLERVIPLGALVRGLHYHGTNVLLILLALHVLHVVLTAGYRRPREVTWWLGLGLVGLVLVFAMTGALLPFDEQGYWASRVEIGIMGTAPVVGRLIQQIAMSGNEVGNLTLTRYYAVHAVVLPLLLGGLVWAHLSLSQRHGAAPSALRVGARGTGYWPGQTFRDAALAFLVVLGVFWCAAHFGAPLEAPADPAGGFPARPVWYFRPLFELRRHFEGPLEPISTMVLPGLATAFLVGLPFLDRAATLRGRSPYIAAVTGGIVLAVIGGRISFHRDSLDKAYQAQKEAAATRVALARTVAAAEGVPPEGALFMLQNTPESRGEKLFTERCVGCHAVDGKGTDKPKGPDLGGYLSRDWLVGVISHPEASEFFGLTKASGMDPYEKLGKERINLLAGLLEELGKNPGKPPSALPPSLKPALDAFDTEGCASCHSITPGEENGAPNLSGYGSEQWLAGLMLTPGDKLYFAEDNDMPSYKGKLSDKELHAIVAYLNTLRGKPVQYGQLVAATHN
jgi:ubiquinol-cytochrome c reductase cytochrome b subunit